MPLRGRKRATVPMRPRADGRRAIGDAAHAGDAVRDADDALGREAAGDHVLLQAGRDGDQAVGAVDRVPFDERVRAR